MPALHQALHQPFVLHINHDRRRFQRIVHALLCTPCEVFAAIADSAGGHVGGSHAPRGQADARANHPSDWPTGCRLSKSEQALAVWCGKEPMSWEV